MFFKINLNKGVKFHLVLTLYIMNEDEEVPKVLNSTISPPIFVDSRKSARDSHLLMVKFYIKINKIILFS